MGIRASLSFRYIAPTTRTAKSSILTPKIAKIPFAETGWLETAPSATERQMRKFKSPGQAQQFLTVHGLVQNLFRVGRHLLQARHHRELRGRAFIAWHEVTCA